MTAILDLDFDKIIYVDKMINWSLNSQFALEL